MRYQQTRYIPKDSTEIQHPDGLGVVYVYMSGAKFGVIAYRGKANRNSFHYTYRTTEQRQKQIDEFFAGLTARRDYIQKQRDERKQPKPARVKDPNCQHVRIGMVGDIPVCLDCEGPEHIDIVSTAKIIRDEIAKAFPETKFSVRSKSYSGGCSIDVSYTDGPPTKPVEEIAKQFEGASFDGMQDLKSYHSSIWNGRAVKWGPDYVFVHRRFTDESARYAEAETALRALIADYQPWAAPFTPWALLTIWDARWETIERAARRLLAERGCCV